MERVNQTAASASTSCIPGYFYSPNDTAIPFLGRIEASSPLLILLASNHGITLSPSTPGLSVQSWGHFFNVPGHR